MAKTEEEMIESSTPTLNHRSVEMLEAFVKRITAINETLTLSVAQLSILIDLELHQLRQIYKELGMSGIPDNFTPEEWLLAIESGSFPSSPRPKEEPQSEPESVTDMGLQSENEEERIPAKEEFKLENPIESTLPSPSRDLESPKPEEKIEAEPSLEDSFAFYFENVAATIRKKSKESISDECSMKLILPGLICNLPFLAKMKDSHLKSLGLDVERLEYELRQSVRLEERRWHENDAKLRAVEQKVATYDEFKNMVDACELQPLTCKDVQEANKQNTGWARNFSATAYSIPKINKDIPYSEGTPIKQFNRIDEFMLCWNGLAKSQSNIDLFTLLERQSDELLKETFASSAGLSILSRVLNCLQDAISRDSSSVIRLLKAIGSSKNFVLTTTLMSDEELNLVKLIFQTLEENSEVSIDGHLRSLWISA
ncbi:unnamed protein product [Rodentolepis nana]|uniref:RNA polymerase II-associated protein 3 n=1 Tax=Rodentolepis nana TaxID=102285 RepID=A0A0R3T110_RODNA|nr:unnamed protein product [Rodentolepis nana]